MVSELRTSKIDVETFSSLLGSAALVEDDYRPLVKHVVQRLEPRSPAFELFRQALERVEPHFGGNAAFNAAFVGDAATVQRFFDVHTAATTENKWRIVREVVIAACPAPTLSAEEQLARCTKTKGETWADFVDKYLAACTVSAASRETQVKTLYRKLPSNIRRLMLHLPPTATAADMRMVMRNMSFWESGAAAKAEPDEDAMEIDMGVIEANAATDGRVVGHDGSINFSAITNAGRVMVGAREICKTSRREALNMLRFLQRICASNDTGPRRTQNQTRRWNGRRAFVAEDSAPEGSGEHIAETLSEGNEEEEHDALLASVATATKPKGT